MTKVGCISFLISFISISKIFSQSFPEFEKLRNKADSACQAKNYSLSAEFYESALRLPEMKKPEIFGVIYYNMACVYSLNRDSEKALNYLEKSFFVYNSKKGTNPVSGVDLATDADLNLIRNQPGFRAIIKKYYPSNELKKVYEAERFSDKKISYTELLRFIELLSKEDDYLVTVHDKEIYWEKSGDSIKYNENSIPIPSSPVLKSRPIVFNKCSFKLNFIWSGESKFNKQEFPLAGFEFHDCHFFERFSVTHFQIKGPPVDYQFLFTNCKFDKTFNLTIHVEPRQRSNLEGFQNCVFSQFASMDVIGSTPINFQFSNNSVLNDLDISGTSALFFAIENNTFKGDVQFSFDEIDVAKIINNKIKDLLFICPKLSTEFDFLRNRLLGKLALTQTLLPQTTASDIDWSTLNNFHVGFGRDNYIGTKSNPEYGSIQESHSIDSTQFLTGEHDKEIPDGDLFRELMGIYSSFINVFKTKSDMESYNACFIQIKELQSKRLKYLYESSPTFEKYFRWKLSELLRFYVRYGTDPARAIVISIYIIICFGVFFFFFPSDWDVTSKKRLIENFRDFSQKNEKGYVKPFFVLLWGFIISLINAVTLSLNAFITLGFGNIPTHGIARYFCVLEGFLGWFLLSIFTVAMINQVL
jgi:hypothetical protein